MRLSETETSFPGTDQRLAAVNRYLKEDLRNVKDLDDIVEMISHICESPIVYISIIDDVNQTLIAKTGIDVKVVEKSQTFCYQTIQQDELVVINDASQHPVYKTSPFVQGHPGIRFYAGMPVRTLGGHNIGTICVLDDKPRSLNTYQLESLKILSNHVIYLLELRVALNFARDKQQSKESSENMLMKKYKEQNKQLQSLASVMSHQVSGPVATMKGLMYLINTLPEEESKEYLPLMDLVLNQMDEAIKMVTANAFAAVETE